MSNVGAINGCSSKSTLQSMAQCRRQLKRLKNLVRIYVKLLHKAKFILLRKPFLANSEVPKSPIVRIKVSLLQSNKMLKCKSNVIFLERRRQILLKFYVFHPKKLLQYKSKVVLHLKVSEITGSITGFKRPIVKVS